MTTPSAEVLEHLAASRPQQLLARDRPWLVVYYGIILSMVSSTNPSDEYTKARLKSNLWIALNDVRLLLEPSDVKIQAMILVACHPEEFTTPSLCWMLVANACRMLQAMGVMHRRSDVESRERRSILFWHLNLLDKGLAVVFCRPPTFHRAMAKEIEMPTMTQLLPFQPHRASASGPALFGAHFMHHLHLISDIMGDIWHCLYERDTNVGAISAVKDRVDLWHRQATEVRAMLISRISVWMNRPLILMTVLERRCARRKAIP